MEAGYFADFLTPPTVSKHRKQNQMQLQRRTNPTNGKRDISCLLVFQHQKSLTCLQFHQIHLTVDFSTTVRRKK